ncbi:MAG TPA: MFS transporter [Aggregatilineales bacterium]|nr:MFS transporter [Aggregatilineales bacterium]
MASIVRNNATLTSEERHYQRRWIALLLLSLGLTLIIVDSTVVNIAFPSIRKTFNAAFTDAEWVNSIYSLVFGAALIMWGKIADQYGRRNVFIAGVAVFVLGSLGTGLSQSIGMTIFWRAVEGMGAAMMSPATLSIISATFKGRERSLAFGIWGGTAGIAAVLGPILGGWLITYGTAITPESWRLAFLINVPIGIIAILGSSWSILESREGTSSHRLDWPGIVFSTLGLSTIVFASIEGQNYGWFAAKRPFALGPIIYPAGVAGNAVPPGTVSFIPFVFLFGLLMLFAFVLVENWQEHRGLETLFEFSLFKYRSFAFGLMTVLIVSLGEFGTILVISIFFQLASGLNAFQTGLRFLPFAGAVLIAAPTAGALAWRLGARWVVTCGMMCEAAALFWMSRILYENVSFWYFVPPFILYGIGVGLAIAQLANIVLSDIPQEKFGLASGANNTIRQLGASLGIAVIGGVLFGLFVSESRPLIDNSTAFEDFGQRVAANPNISPQARTFGASIVSFGGVAKQALENGLDNGSAFDANISVIDTAIQQISAIAPAKLALKFQGVDLDNPATVRQIQVDLTPDAVILGRDLEAALGEGFSTAGRTASAVAGVFVLLGAVSSLLLPNAKYRRAEASA